MNSTITRVYKYDSSKESTGYKGEDFSNYVLIGDSDNDNLDDTLDTYELTLTGLPFREEFDPTTKFIIEKWQESIAENGEKTTSLWKTWHLCVSDDAVSQPILSDDNYFDHHLTLIEAGVEAQQRLVDNISVTYKLQDVTIDKEPTYGLTDTIDVSPVDAVYTGDVEPYGHQLGFLGVTNQYVTGHKFTWVMPDYYNVTINGASQKPSWDTWKNFKLNQVIPLTDSSKVVQFPIPMLQCWGYYDGTTRVEGFNCYCSIDVIVQKRNAYNNTLIKTDSYQVNPSNTYEAEKVWNYDDKNSDVSRTYFGHIVSRVDPTDASLNLKYYISKISQLGSTPDGIAASGNSFTTLLNRVLSITIEPNFTYSVVIRRHVFNTLDISNYAYVDIYPFLYCSWYKKWFVTGQWPTDQTDDNRPVFNTVKFNVFLEGEKGKIVFQSAPPATAYDLFNKAQLTTQTTLKNSSYSVDETPKAFYLKDEDKQQLKNTAIVEAFYNQYNLWQIFMDIGKYIHARPVVKFGKNNKFEVDWKKYGQTTQSEDFGDPISVYNSRFIEEYISACSSYITNMVQMGGIITETVAPKSSSEDYLVYNDVAEIIVSKPIIEIISIEAIAKENISFTGYAKNYIAKGTTKDITNYTFEKGVYKILSINKDESINKGLAIYYTLGTNKIVGLNYQLPVINSGDTQGQYAIKRLLTRAFISTQQSDESDVEYQSRYSNMETNLKVNQFLFKVVYRTKDTLRSNQTRPDLRKYLLSTPYDRVPQHNQFNNQQDTVVDSVKFGNNIYGKLIRTGNTVYTKVEWVDNLFHLKQSGQLYNIYGNLYYVSRVKNTYYPDHIISEVEFSKDFNRLSQIIGIPSEPRFYEISEQSLIDREVAIDDYLVVGTSIKTTSGSNSFIRAKGWTYIASLLLSNESSYPQYAITLFKGDAKKGASDFEVGVCHPVSTFSTQNTLTLEWDMEDNFSAGDQVNATAYSLTPDKAVDTAYNTLTPFCYTDKYGRIDMFDFAILKSYNLSVDQVVKLPENPINLSSSADTTTKNNFLFGNNELGGFNSHNKGIVLLKDNREVVKLNYNIQLITDSDRFVLSAYVWQNEKQNLRIALLNQEVNKISNMTLENNLFQVENIPFTYTVNETNNNIKINISTALASYDLTKYKAIAIYSTNLINDYVNSGAKYFVMARNIGGLTNTEAKADWYISNFDKSMFKKQ